MSNVKNYFFAIIIASLVVPMHGMQNGLRYIRKQFNCPSHYDVLEISPNSTDAEIRKAYHKISLKNHPDRNRGNTTEVTEKMQRIVGAYEVLSDPIKKKQYSLYCTFVDFCITGCLAMGTVATVTGLVKARQAYKEYSSPNSILLEKMESVAQKAVVVILNSQFDRYNPTKDTDSLCMQFDVEPLLTQLSSDEVRAQVKRAIVEFDKTLEFTYEQCAWHYDGMALEGLLTQNPRLVHAIIAKLDEVKKAFALCRNDLQLDRNKPLEFFKAYYKKVIGAGLVGLGGWYFLKKFMSTQDIQMAPILLL